MTKNNDQAAIGVIIAIIALAFILSQIGLKPASVVPLEGFQVMSASNVNINGQSQLVMTTSMGSAQKGYIDISGAAGNQLQAAGLNPKNITLTAELLEQSCRFRIDYQNELIYSASVASTTFDTCTIYNANTCSAYSLSQCTNKNPITGQQTYYGDNYCYTYGDTPSYQKGYINTNEFAPTWAVKIKMFFEDGTSIEKTLDNQNSVADFGPIGSVSWAGGLVDRLFCGSPTNTLLVRGITEQSWKKVPYNLYNDYFSAYNVYQSSKGAILPGWNAAQALNSKVTAIGTGREPTPYDNYYSYTPSQNIVNPVLVWTLNTQSIAIEAPKLAVAEFVSLQTEAIEETQTANIHITLKNKGTQTDNFDIKIDNCNSPLTLANKRITIQTGETATTDLLVEGVPNSYRCTLTATPVNNPAGADSESITININKRACPDSFACCAMLPNYRDRGCKDTAKTISNNNTIHDANGVLTGYEYTSYIEIQHYACSSYTCNPSTTEQLDGSYIATVVPPGFEGSIPTPIITYTPPEPSTEPAPQPTTIIFTPGQQPSGGAIHLGSGDTLMWIFLAGIFIIGVFLFMRSQK